MQDILSVYNNTISNSNKQPTIKSNILSNYHSTVNSFSTKNIYDTYTSGDQYIINEKFNLSVQTLLKLNSNNNKTLSTFITPSLYQIRKDSGSTYSGWSAHYLNSNFNTDILIGFDNKNTYRFISSDISLQSKDVLISNNTLISNHSILYNFDNDTSLKIISTYRKLIQVGISIDKYGSILSSDVSSYNLSKWWLQQRNEFNLIPAGLSNILFDMIPINYAKNRDSLSYFNAFNPLGLTNVFNTTLNVVSMPSTSYERNFGLLERIINYYYNVKLAIDHKKFTEDKFHYDPILDKDMTNTNNLTTKYPNKDTTSFYSRLGFPDYISTGSVDRINVLDAYASLDNIDNNIKFVFETSVIKNNTDVRPIIFRSTLTGIKDSISPEWNSIDYMGRPDTFYQYKGFTREISFSFTVYINDESEVGPQWSKLNALAGLCYPVEYYNNRTMKPPIIRLTIGDMFNRVYGFISSYSMGPHDDSMWLTTRINNKNIELPHVVIVDISFTVISDNTDSETTFSPQQSHKRYLVT